MKNPFLENFRPYIPAMGTGAARRDDLSDPGALRHLSGDYADILATVSFIVLAVFLYLAGRDAIFGGNGTSLAEPAVATEVRESDL